MREPVLRGVKNRALALLALYAPGAESTRVAFHRWRGVEIADGANIAIGVIIETSMPNLVTIGKNAHVGVRSVLIGHFRDAPRQDEKGRPYSIRIEDEAFLGPGVIVLPNVTIGYGAVVTAGSVVSRSVPPLTMVRGNPAKPIARCGVPLGMTTPLDEFYRKLKPIRDSE
jgi:acetyltransferase-like isoleucine patch superfamily enzyme